MTGWKCCERGEAWGRRNWVGESQDLEANNTVGFARSKKSEIEKFQDESFKMKLFQALQSPNFF